MHNKFLDISIVVPVYNSAPVVAELVRRVQQAMMESRLTYELILTDDCSTDNSWQAILNLCKFDKRIVGLRLDKNHGQWCATLAGMSVANGKYIVTMDDDLEYEPLDIAELYKAITTNDYMVLFGIAADKYAMQRKSQSFSTVRNKLLNILWNKPVTDSFRIMKRSLFFDGDRFLPTEPIDVFITHKIRPQQCGYYSVRFNNRYRGVSNHSFNKKIRLFFVYSAYYATHLVRRIVLLAILVFILAGTGWLLFLQHKLMQELLILVIAAMASIGLLLLYYIIALINRPNQVTQFSITETVNKVSLSSSVG